MLKFIKRLLVRSDGQDLIEYALLAAFISIATLVALGGIGGNVGATYQKVDTAIAAAKTSDDPGQPGAGASDPAAAIQPAAIRVVAVVRPEAALATATETTETAMGTGAGTAATVAAMETGTTEMAMGTAEGTAATARAAAAATPV